MVLTPFAWPYGGHQVFLCGSFTGWIEHEQMILAEGSSSIFQTIRDLPPGYYQYKFFVDGVWRFDERRDCVQDEYGTINNIILVKEPELGSQTILAETFQPSMDIDKDYAVGCNDIEVSRRRLSLHLSFYKTFELIPDSGKVFALDVNVAVDEAFQVMYEQGLSVVPLWDAPSRQISGMLTASDFIFILIELRKNPAVLTNELLEMHTISAWKDGKLLLHPQVDSSSQLVYRRPLIQAGPDESLNDVALRILQNKISTVPVLHLTQDGSFAQLLHIACLAGILKHICRHFRHCLEYLPLVHQPVGSLPLGTWKREVGIASGRILLTLRPGDLLSSALNLLMEAQVSSIPIVDDNGTLINVFSRSDITALAKGSVYAHIQLDRTTISQVLELVEGTPDRYQTCKRTDSLYNVMELLSNPVVRRLIVTKAGSQQVEGIITLRDVFNLILN